MAELGQLAVLHLAYGKWKKYSGGAQELRQQLEEEGTIIYAPKEPMVNGLGRMVELQGPALNLVRVMRALAHRLTGRDVLPEFYSQEDRLWYLQHEGVNVGPFSGRQMCAWAAQAVGQAVNSEPGGLPPDAKLHAHVSCTKLGMVAPLWLVISHYQLPGQDRACLPGEPTAVQQPTSVASSQRNAAAAGVAASQHGTAAVSERDSAAAAASSLGVHSHGAAVVHAPEAHAHAPGDGYEMYDEDGDVVMQDIREHIQTFRSTLVYKDIVTAAELRDQADEQGTQHLPDLMDFVVDHVPALHAVAQATQQQAPETLIPRRPGLVHLHLVLDTSFLCNPVGQQILRLVHERYGPAAVGQHAVRTFVVSAVVPLRVYGELDGLKQSDGKVQGYARGALNLLLERVRVRDGFMALQTRQEYGASIKSETEPPSTDVSVVLCARHLTNIFQQQQTDSTSVDDSVHDDAAGGRQSDMVTRSVMVLSNDVGLNLQAESEKILTASQLDLPPPTDTTSMDSFFDELTATGNRPQQWAETYGNAPAGTDRGRLGGGTSARPSQNGGTGRSAGPQQGQSSSDAGAENTPNLSLRIKPTQSGEMVHVEVDMHDAGAGSPHMSRYLVERYDDQPRQQPAQQQHVHQAVGSGGGMPTGASVGGGQLQPTGSSTTAGLALGQGVNMTPPYPVVNISYDDVDDDYSYNAPRRTSSSHHAAHGGRHPHGPVQPGIGVRPGGGYQAPGAAQHMLAGYHMPGTAPSMAAGYQVPGMAQNVHMAGHHMPSHAALHTTTARDQSGPRHAAPGAVPGGNDSDDDYGYGYPSQPRASQPRQHGSLTTQRPGMHQGPGQLPVGLAQASGPAGNLGAARAVSLPSNQTSMQQQQELQSGASLDLQQVAHLLQATGGAVTPVMMHQLQLIARAQQRQQQQQAGSTATSGGSQLASSMLQGAQQGSTGFHMDTTGSAAPRPQAQSPCLASSSAVGQGLPSLPQQQQQSHLQSISGHIDELQAAGSSRSLPSSALAGMMQGGSTGLGGMNLSGARTSTQPAHPSSMQQNTANVPGAAGQQPQRSLSQRELQQQLQQQLQQLQLLRSGSGNQTGQLGDMHRQASLGQGGTVGLAGQASGSNIGQPGSLPRAPSGGNMAAVDGMSTSQGMPSQMQAQAQAQMLAALRQQQQQQQLLAQQAAQAQQGLLKPADDQQQQQGQQQQGQQVLTPQQQRGVLEAMQLASMAVQGGKVTQEQGAQLLHSTLIEKGIQNPAEAILQVAALSRASQQQQQQQQSSAVRPHASGAGAQVLSHEETLQALGLAQGPRGVPTTAPGGTQALAQQQQAAMLNALMQQRMAGAPSGAAINNMTGVPGMMPGGFGAGAGVNLPGAVNVAAGAGSGSLPAHMLAGSQPSQRATASLGHDDDDDDDYGYTKPRQQQAAAHHQHMSGRGGHMGHAAVSHRGGPSMGGTGRAAGATASLHEMHAKLTGGQHNVYQPNKPDS